MSRNQLISIAAAGQGERMKANIRDLGFSEDLPKPLLPTGNGETLLGRIARQALKVADVQVFANYDTIKPIGESLDLPRDVQLLVNRNITGPLGALYLDLERSKQRSMMAAGDFWADFEWNDFIAFHESQNTPVSIMVAPSVPAKEGARFKVNDNGNVTAWERVTQTSETDLINIGAYIVDPERLVMHVIRTLRSHKEDPFNDAMIERKLLSAYVLEDVAFNVNNIDIYNAMVAHTSIAPSTYDEVQAC